MEPRLSLCMIVRDEAAMLPGFLAACGGLWDELCVADTGSTDGSRALLADAGATVTSFAWCDDFAAARNASLAMATGDWILFLDADERPTPELRAQIRALLGDATAGAATVVMRNELPHGHVRESRLLRLFRRDASLRFTHRIHEDVSRSVGAMLQRAGQRLVALPGRVQHLGYVRQVAASRAKKERDARLLRACIAEDPQDWYSRYKLLELARFWQDEAMAQTAAREAAPLLGGADLHGEVWGGEFLTLVAQGLHHDPAAQLRALDGWAPLADPSAAWHLRRGTLHETLGDLAAAREEFTRCLASPPAADPSLTSVRPYLGLCRVAAACGDLAAATGHIEAALAANPRDPEALHAGVAFAWLTGRKPALVRFLATHPASEELDLAAGEHHLRIGHWAEARTALARAAGQPPQGRAAFLLAQAMLGDGDAAACLGLCRAIQGEVPAAALGIVTCALALGEAVDLTIDMTPHAADAALLAWIGVLWRGRSTALRQGFGAHWPVVADAFPWLAEHMDRLEPVPAHEE